MSSLIYFIDVLQVSSYAFSSLWLNILVPFSWLNAAAVFVITGRIFFSNELDLDKRKP